MGVFGAILLSLAGSQPFFVATAVATARGRSSPPPALILEWQPGAIACDDRILRPASLIPAPYPRRSVRMPVRPSEATYRFTLGAEGRAMSIDFVKPELDGIIDPTPPYRQEIVPALAAARFEPVDEPVQCLVQFTENAIRMSEASLEQLIRLRIAARKARVSNEVWSRFAPGNCTTKRLKTLRRDYPDFRKVDPIPGSNHWTFVSYDVDAQGASENITVVGSSGGDQLNTEVTEAVESSLHVDAEPRTGCWFYYYKGAGVIEEPERPDLETYGDQPEACEADDKWAEAPRLDYPRTYQRRGIEGWVVLQYDVAPWGEIGNVEVLDAQPARDLVQFAERVLTSGRYKVAGSGLSGCIERVVFKLPEKPADE